MELINVIHNLDNYREVLETDLDEDILKRIRKWRDSELVATDWTQIPDVPVDKEIWATYRQELRDLPESNLNPRKIHLPNFDEIKLKIETERLAAQQEPVVTQE